MDFWYKPTGVAVAPAYDGIAIATALYGQLSTPIVNCLTTSLSGTIAKVVGCNVEVNDGVFTVGTPYYNILDGTVSDDFLPGEVSVVIQKITGIAGRTGRGRWFMPGCPETFTAGSYLNAMGKTAYTTAATAFLANVTATITAGTCIMKPVHFLAHTGTINEIASAPVVSLLGRKSRRKGRF